MYEIIEEGKIKIKVPKEKKISKELPVFYNQVMELNRTISILLLNCLEDVGIVGLPLSGTGVRGIRILKEAKVDEVWFNDLNKEAIKVIKQNIKLNKIKGKYKVFNKDANMFILESAGFDYIDIDPYGSPNVFLDSSIKRLSRGGILAVTATDTGCLAGSFPKACVRKYWAKPSRDSNMHENGLRILIRKVQLIGADHDKALTPVYSYFKDHYFRIFFQCEKGKQKVDSVLVNHGMVKDAGPMWLGELWDKKVASEIAKQDNNKFLQVIAKEAKVPVVGFYNIPKLAKKNKFEIIKKTEIVKKVKKAGYKIAESHFSQNSFRSDISEKELIKILK